MIDTSLRKYFQSGFNSLAVASRLTLLHPIQITVFALICGFGTFASLYFGKLLIALFLLWMSGLFDVLDGTVARLTGKSTKLGGYLDMIFDRIVESIVILGFYFYMPEYTLYYILFYIIVQFNFTTFMLAGALFKNSGVKSMHYDFGLVERTESFIVFSLMMLFPEYIPYILTIFNLLTLFTGILRVTRIARYVSLEK